MKKFSKVLIVTMALTLVMAFMPSMAFAASTTPVSAKVTFSATNSWGFDMAGKTIKATSDMAETYYPAIKDNESPGVVTVADVLVAAHIAKYGAAFKNDPTAYLDMTSSSYGTSMTKQFGHSKVGVYIVNNQFTSSGVSTSKVKNGDSVIVGSYDANDKSYAALFSYFDKGSYSTTAGTKLKVTLSAANSDPTTYLQDAVTPSVSTLQTVNTSTGELKATAYKTDTTGAATIKFNTPGTYYISAKGQVTYAGYGGSTTGDIMAPLAKVNVGLKAPTAKLSKKKAASVKVSWGKVTGASKYKVYRATKKSGKYKLIKSTSKTSFTNTKLKRGGHYYYRVKAVKSSYTSSYSKIVKK